jgi:glycosyltransferase involved in cell wall biosynthesis
MKILYLITHPFIGGAQKYVLELIDGLKNKNLEIWLGTSQEGWLTEEVKKINIPVVLFKNLKRSLNPFKNLLLIFEIKNFLDKDRFDLIHLNNSNALLAALGTKISKNKAKTVFTLHGLSILHPNWKKSFFIKSIYYLIFKFCFLFLDKVIFVCQHDLNYALKIKLIKKEKSVLIYNGILEPKFLDKEIAKKEIEKMTGFSLENKKIVGTIARFEYQKNIDNLVKSVRIINRKNIIFLIFGNGPERKNIEKLIKNYNLKNIFLLGEIKNASHYLKAFDFFILPSRYEGFPLVVLEAMWAQLPIIATKVGGVPEMIENKKEGILIESEKPEKAAKTIIQLIENQNLSQQIAEKAYQKVKGYFLLEKMVEETFNLYQETLKG